MFKTDSTTTKFDPKDFGKRKSRFMLKMWDFYMQVPGMHEYLKRGKAGAMTNMLSKLYDSYKTGGLAVVNNFTIRETLLYFVGNVHNTAEFSTLVDKTEKYIKDFFTVPDKVSKK